MNEFCYTRETAIWLYSEASEKSDVVRQVLFGETLQVIGEGEQWVCVQVPGSNSLGFCQNVVFGRYEADAFIKGLATHAYSEANTRSPVLKPLVFSSRVSVATLKEDETKGSDGAGAMVFVEEAGWVPRQLVSQGYNSVEGLFQFAKRFVNSPYLWKGRTYCGIDDFGIVDVCLSSCGIPLDLKILGEDAFSTLRPRRIANRSEILPGDLVIGDVGAFVVGEDSSCVFANMETLLIDCAHLAAFLPSSERYFDGDLFAYNSRV